MMMTPVRTRKVLPQRLGPGDRDPELVARGYCARIDESGRRRCYREAEHAGECVFGTVFQFVQRRT